MENKELTLKVSHLLGEILSRLLIVETEYQKMWQKEELRRGFNKEYAKLRDEIINDIRNCLNQLNSYGIKDYFICDYSKIGNDY